MEPACCCVAMCCDKYAKTKIRFFLLFQISSMARRRLSQKAWEDILFSDSESSEGSDLENCIDTAIYQKCGDMPEEVNMGGERGSLFSLSLTSFYSSNTDTSSEAVSPMGGGASRRKKMKFGAKTERQMEDQEKHENVDDPATSTPVRSPPGRAPSRSQSTPPQSDSVWDTPLFPEEPSIQAVPFENLKFSAVIVPSNDVEKGPSVNMTLEAPGTSFNVQTSLSPRRPVPSPVPSVSGTPVPSVSATPVPSVSVSPTSVSATPTRTSVSATPTSVSATLTSVRATRTSVSASPTPVSVSTPVSVNVRPTPVSVATPLSVSVSPTPSTSGVPVPSLSPNELKSRKRARGPLCESTGSAIVRYEKGTYRTRDGNIWHRDPNPRMPKVTSPHIVPPGSLTQETNELSNPHEFFERFIPDEEVAAITVYTNDKILAFRARFKAQTATTEETNIMEIKALLGILLMTGLKSDNHVSSRQMFAPFQGCSLYRSVMSKSRFTFLMRVLRFDNAQTRAERVAVDRLAPIRSLWDSFISACKTVYVPGPHLTIDEQLVPFRGKAPFKMYIPNKPAK